MLCEQPMIYHKPASIREISFICFGYKGHSREYLFSSLPVTVGVSQQKDLDFLQSANRNLIILLADDILCMYIVQSHTYLSGSQAGDVSTLLKMFTSKPLSATVLLLPEKFRLT